jgi:hypothetical protein
MGRVIAKRDESMRTILTLDDSTGVQDVTFYLKGENEVPVPLKEYKHDEKGS